MVAAVYQALLVINSEEGNQVSHTPFAMTLFLSYLHELQDYKIIYLNLSHIFEINGER